MFLGQEVKTSAGEVSVLDAGGVRMKLPASAAGLALTMDGADAPVLALLELPLAHSLAHLARMGAADDLEGLRAEPPAPSDDDLTQLRTTAGFFAAAFAEEWTHGEAGESADLIMIQDSAWQEDRDPLGEGSWLHVESTITLEGLPADPVALLLPWTVAEKLVPALADPESAAKDDPASAPTTGGGPPPTGGDVTTDRTGSGQNVRPAPRLRHVDANGNPVSIVCIGSDAIAEHIESELEGAVIEKIGTVEEFADAAEHGHVPLLVVATIARDGDAELRTLARLKNEHLLVGRPIMVLLEKPVKSTVLLCGRLGLVNVLPAQVDADVVWRRLAPWIRRESEA